MKKFLLTIFAMFLAFANLQAEEVTVYTLEPAKGSNNSYAGNCDIAIGDITWNLTGNSTMIPWRIGGKSITNVDRALYSKNPMVGAVDKVVLSIGTVNSITVNSAKLLVADNADFTNAVETPFTVTANSDSEIAVTAPAGSYYKFVFNVTVSGSSNKYIQISKAVFYSSTSGETTAAAAPSLPADCSFTESKTIEITNNEEGATVYYTTDGENFNEYVGEFTINETTTVKAYAQIGDDVATKSFEVTRTYTKLEAKTIAEVIEAGEGEAYTKGTVVATYAKGFLLNDETGYILVYQGNVPTVAEGDVININGTTSMYGGLLQFAAGANIEKTGTAEVTHPEAVVMDGAAFDAFLTAPEVKYVEYIGTLTINGNYYNVDVEGAETAIASIQYPNDGLVTVESGEVIKVTGYTIGYNKSYVNTMAVKVEAYVEPTPEPEEPAAGIEVGKHYRIKSTSNGDYLTIGDTNENQYGHVHGAALDEANDNQVFTFIAVEGQENTYYVQSVAGKYFSYEGTGAGWNVNGTDDATKAHALTFEAAEGELQYLIKCYNAAKSDYKYFKYEYVNASGKYHPFNDADLDKAEVWTLEEVAVVEPEPEAPFEVVAVTPREAVAELTTVTVEFSEEIEGTFDMMAMTQIYLGTRSNGCSFEVNGKVLTITPFNAINTPGEYKLVIPEGLITRKSNGEAVTMNGEYVFTVKEAVVEPETFIVTAALFPTVEGDVTEIKGIRVEAGQGPSLAELPTAWTLTNEAGDEFTMYIEWLLFCEDILITVNPAITEAGTYTLTIPAGSLKTDDGKECEAATFSWTVVGPVDPYMPYNNGTRTRADRLIKGITLTGASGENSYALTADEQTQDYTDATAVAVFKVEAGEELTITFDKIGEWIHQFVFIDFDGDGFTASIAEGSEWAPAEDLVAYSFYNNDSSDDYYGWNSVGTSISDNDRNSPAVPAFKAPETIGTYRMRVKQDWCNIDPAGDADGKFGDFKANGGQIIDVILEVVEATTGIENVEAETVKAIYDITGRKIEKVTEGGIYIINGKKVLVK